MPYLPPWDDVSDEVYNKTKTDLDCCRLMQDLEKMNKVLYTDVEKKPGYVYLIQSPSGPCKIGMTMQNPYLRCKELQTSHWEDLKVRWVIRTVKPNAYESILHRYMKPFHIKREWFSIKEDLIKHLTEGVREFKWVNPGWYGLREEAGV